MTANIDCRMSVPKGPPLPRVTPALAVIVGALALAGCGSGKTETVSVSSAPAPKTSTSPVTKTTTTTSTPTQTASSTGNETTRATTRTRTAPAPAFTKEAGATEGLNMAVAVLGAHGYTANDTSQYHPAQTLRVLVGTHNGSSDGYGQQAFFFVGNHYIGTDASEPSATVKVVNQSDTEVTLAYPLYKPHDPLCCASGGQKTVRFQLNNGHLVALDQIPPGSSQSGLSRN